MTDNDMDLQIALDIRASINLARYGSDGPAPFGVAPVDRGDTTRQELDFLANAIEALARHVSRMERS